ncbi:MAG: 3-isopropylmalate dehydratase small subunit [Firmicutes bacterium]|nr:3-isopropylmalate dehydratase small subunit [Bacillota bacterium]
MNYLKGRAWVFGDDIDTDAIIPARYLTTQDPKDLALHCMEDADPHFAGKVQAGDIIVGGKNFGCGSSREHAPIAIRAAGISCVVAQSFARIFYRNAINIGLPIVECPAAAKAAREGDVLSVDLARGVVENLTLGETYKAVAFPEFMQEIIQSGGLIGFVRQGLGEEG